MYEDGEPQTPETTEDGEAARRSIPLPWRRGNKAEIGSVRANGDGRAQTAITNPAGRPTPLPRPREA